MLTPIARTDIPGCGARAKSELRLFCDETVREFLDGTSPGDCCEVTGAPVRMDARGVQRVAESLRDALCALDRDGGWRREVRVMTRGGSRVFLERTEPRPLMHRGPRL